MPLNGTDWPMMIESAVTPFSERAGPVTKAVKSNNDAQSRLGVI
jgi:hypothetical protein